MLISSAGRRKLLVLRSFCAHQRELVLDQRVGDVVDRGAHRGVLVGLEDGAVAVDLHRRRAAGAQLGGDLAAGGPGAAFEDAGERQLSRAAPSALRTAARARRSARP
jgi:hypothetical protein